MSLSSVGYRATPTACTVEPASKGTEPEIDPNPGRTVPTAPVLSQIVALSQEPARGMHVIILDGSNNEDGYRLERATTGPGLRFASELGLKVAPTRIPTVFRHALPVRARRFPYEQSRTA